MLETLANVLMPLPIMGITINTVFLHPAVRTILYLAIVVSLVTGFLVFLRRSPSFVTAARKAVILSFFLSGLLAAVYADIGWSVWVSRDYENLSGLSVNGKLTRIEGQLYDFTQRAGAIIQDSYQIYAPAYISLRSQYWLLPLRKRDDARYIVVIEDPAARYDPANRVFSHDDKRFPNMDLVLNYAPQVYVLKGP
jgi:hypothetical protein